jgi:glycosyltransferase involved in cell wall biosynthesis
MMANELCSRKIGTRILSPAPRRFFGALAPEVALSFVPVPLGLISRITGVRLGNNAGYLDSVIFDRLAAMRLSACDFVIGWAHVSLVTARRAKNLGAKFVLDRACPHVDFQQQLLEEEAEKVGHKFVRQPEWFIERQYEEYQVADAILVPSHYSKDSFPSPLRQKIIVAPIFGRFRNQPFDGTPGGGKTFVVGVVGGEPLRKGYLYLLKAWKKLNLPNAVLRIRAARGFSEFPVLRELALECRNVELVDYVQDMNEFYKACDLFILPSIDDGFGMALFEAMSNGVPCIATTRCGSVELLSHKADAYIIRPYDSEEISSAIEYLYYNSEFRIRLGHSGRERVSGMRSGATTYQYRKAFDQLLLKCGLH